MIKMDKKNTPINDFLDFSKTFERLNHTILLAILKVLWHRWYCTETNGKLYYQQNTICGNRWSENRSAKSFNWNPLGSILCPLLLIIYKNDIVNASN